MKNEMPTTRQLINKIRTKRGMTRDTPSISFRCSRTILGYLDKPVAAYAISRNMFVAIVPTIKGFQPITYSVLNPLSKYPTTTISVTTMDNVLEEIENKEQYYDFMIDEEEMKKITELDNKGFVGKIVIREHYEPKEGRELSTYHIDKNRNFKVYYNNKKYSFKQDDEFLITRMTFNGVMSYLSDALRNVKEDHHSCYKLLSVKSNTIEEKHMETIMKKHIVNKITD